MDRMTPAQRRACMQRVRSRDTVPEKMLRSSLHRAGYRFRLYRRALPGNPDVVFPGRRKVIFVHGCFWHSHRCRSNLRPKSNESYWIKKLDGNKKRDARNKRQLTALGWRSLVLWECEVRADKALKKALNFLEERTQQPRKPVGTGDVLQEPR